MLMQLLKLYRYRSLCVCVCVKVCVCVSGGCNPSLREPMKETAGAKRLRSAPPPSPPTPQPRYLLYPGCQVVAAQQNKVNHGQTRAFAFSTNEGLLPCSDQCVQVFVCSRSPVIHYACSQTSFRSWLRQNSGELLCACVRVDVHTVCVCLLFASSLKLCSTLKTALSCSYLPIDLTCCCLLDARNKNVFADLP